MRTFKELLRRLEEVQGVPFKELAEAHGITWPEDIRHQKQLGGAFVEAVLGLRANPVAAPDLTDLNLEVKTVPVGDALQVLEHTKITMLNFQDVHDQEWERSTVLHKLRSILFAPVVKYDKTHPDRWYVRSPFIWMPSTRGMDDLRADYEQVRALIRNGHPDKISSAEPPQGQGKYLIANTAGRDATDTTTYRIGENKVSVKRRAWMLRKHFVEALLAENIAYKSPFPPASKSAQKKLSGTDLLDEPDDTQT